MRTTSQSGQSLIELVIGIAIGIIFITGALGIITLALRLDFENKFSQSASELTQSLSEGVTAIANGDWHAIDSRTHGTDSQYHLTDQSGFLAIADGSQSVTVNDQPYTVFFTMEDASRTIAGVDAPDPSTVTITAHAQWQAANNTGEVTFASTLTRNRNRVFTQTDWSGGEYIGHQNNTFDDSVTVQNYFATSTNLDYSDVAGEITIKDKTLSDTSQQGGLFSNIDPLFPYAWNDVIGWVDFRSTNTVTVSTTQMTGFATSSVGFISLNCNSAPPAGLSVCIPGGGNANYWVTNDGSGNLAGMAWNDMIGWVSFCGNSTSASTWNGSTWVCPASPTYQVKVNQTTGDFSGVAWNDSIGWISFNCLDVGACGTSAYKVKEIVGATPPAQASVTSLIYDTHQTAGAAYNAIVWQGDAPSGSRVLFQIATDCLPGQGTAPSCAGGVDGWDFVGPQGESSYYEGPADTSIQIPRNSGNNNKQYVRYKAVLVSDQAKTFTPTVRDISLNWSL